MSHYYKSHIVKIRKQFWKITVKMVSRTYTYYLEISSRKSQTKKSGTNLSWLRWTKLWSVEQRIYSRKSRRMPTRAGVTDSRILVSHFESQLRTRKMTKKIKNYFWLNFEKNVVTWWYYRSNTVETVLSKKRPYIWGYLIIRIS